MDQGEVEVGEQHMDMTDVGVGSRMHEESWSDKFAIVCVQEHNIRAQGLMHGKSFRMIFCPSTAKGKLGTAVWFHERGRVLRHLKFDAPRCKKSN